MTRAWRIAVREYVAFVRTVGFWLSICLIPFGLLVVAFASGLAAKAAPPPKVAIVDMAGGAYGKAITAVLAGPSGRPPQAVIVPAPGAPFLDEADAARRLEPYLSQNLPRSSPQRLDAVAIVGGRPDAPNLDLWTREIAEPGLQALAADAVSNVARKERLARAGLSPAAIRALEGPDPSVTQYSPRSAAGRVSARDALPAYIGFGMGIVLWSLILTGAGILLNSVIEEKSSRILEVLLTSASASEIIGGKIAGAAAVTATALMVWLAAAGLALGFRNPQALADVASLVLQKGLIFYFALYFVAGYLMYATLFTTIGAFCETTREAQTLLGPMMVLLSIPLIFMGQAVVRPDAPLLEALSWVPPFTPFLMAARAASGPPWWEVAGTTAGMAAMTGLELWVAGRAFRAGALSGGRFDIRVFLAGVAGRGEGA
jgi:ABC-2 type transport system permease protein